MVRGGGLTDTQPQLNVLIRKQDNTHTHPYPPSGGGSISAISPSREPAAVGDAHIASAPAPGTGNLENDEVVEVVVVVESAGEGGEEGVMAAVSSTASSSGGGPGIGEPELPFTRHFSSTVSLSARIILDSIEGREVDRSVWKMSSVGGDQPL